jgi:hypothetical protein
VFLGPRTVEWHLWQAVSKLGILYLERATFVTGEVVHIDGGQAAPLSGYPIVASTMAMSCSVVPPLTPTPPITWPSLVSGGTTEQDIAEYLPPEAARRG